MITLKKGTETMKVSQSTYNIYKNTYKRAGYSVVGEVKSEEVDTPKNPLTPVTPQGEAGAAGSETPKEKTLAEMNFEELEKKANELGVDVAGLNSKDKRREAIQAFLDSQEVPEAPQVPDQNSGENGGN